MAGGLEKIAQLQQMERSSALTEATRMETEKKRSIEAASQAANAPKYPGGGTLQGPPQEQTTEEKERAYAEELRRRGHFEEADALEKASAESELKQMEVQHGQFSLNMENLVAGYQLAQAGHNDLALERVRKVMPQVTKIEPLQDGRVKVHGPNGSQTVSIEQLQELRASADTQWMQKMANKRSALGGATPEPKKITANDVKVMAAGLDVYATLEPRLTHLKGKDRIQFSKDVLDRSRRKLAEAKNQGRVLGEDDARKEAIIELSDDIQDDNVTIGGMNIFSGAKYSPTEKTKGTTSTAPAMTHEQSVLKSFMEVNGITDPEQAKAMIEAEKRRRAMEEASNQKKEQIGAFNAL